MAIGKECTTYLDRLDARTGRLHLISRIGNVVDDLALSPDGQHVAYMSYPYCKVPPKTKGINPGGGIGPGAGEGFNAYVLVIFDLATGTQISTATPDPGNPLRSLSWSPDGRRLAAEYDGPHGIAIRVFDVSHGLSFARAASINATRYCAYLAPAWTTSGIIAAEGCDKKSSVPSPSRLLRLSPTGKVLHEWSLPGCINGLGIFADGRSVSILVAMLGYVSNEPCDKAGGVFGAYAVMALGNDGLRTIVRTDISRTPHHDETIGW
ncbi:MAG: hypothetical protein ACXVQY_07485 [Actinomycetota bacterium]